MHVENACGMPQNAVLAANAPRVLSKGILVVLSRNWTFPPRRRDVGEQND
eukprot:COSAG02_NODE_55_length_43887_cov_30.660364_11_plen_50_part_00